MTKKSLSQNYKDVLRKKFVNTANYINITNYINIRLAEKFVQLVNILFNKALGENEKCVLVLKSE